MPVGLSMQPTQKLFGLERYRFGRPDASGDAVERALGECERHKQFCAASRTKSALAAPEEIPRPAAGRSTQDAPVGYGRAGGQRARSRRRSPFFACLNRALDRTGFSRPA